MKAGLSIPTEDSMAVRVDNSWEKPIHVQLFCFQSYKKKLLRTSQNETLIREQNIQQEKNKQG